MSMQNQLILLVTLPLVSSVISYLIGMFNEKYRNIFLMLMMFVEVYVAYSFYRWIQYGGTITVYISRIMGTGLVLTLSMYRYVFVIITLLAWFVTMIYSFMYITRYEHRNRYFMIFTLTLGATLGFFLSDNIINMFTFFETLTIAIYLLIIHDEDAYSHDAGEIYLNMAIFGGLVQLLGIFLLYAYTGTIMISQVGIEFGKLGMSKYIISFLIFIGFAVKASCFPLHVWLPKAHPAAPSPASAVLSGVMLKCGVFGIIMIAKDFLNYDSIFQTVLLVIAFSNIIFTGILAMYQRNLKRIMAFSSMSQIGFILLGIALINPQHHYAAYGTILYIINHSIYKVLLFLCAGVLMMITKDLSLNKIKGYGRGLWLLFVVFLLGILGLTSFPGFNGFLGKTLLYHALELYVSEHGIGFKFLIWLFELGSMITVAYALKMLVAIFSRPHEAVSFKAPSKWIYLPLLMLGGIIYYEGTHPQDVMALLSIPAQQLGGMPHFDYAFYTRDNILHSLSLFVFGGFIYYFFINKRLVEVRNGKAVYINPSLNWISFEKMLYKPMMELIVHKIPRKMLNVEARLLLFVSHMGNLLEKSLHIRFKTGDNQSYSFRETIDIVANFLKTTSGTMILTLLATMMIYMTLTLI